MEDLVTQDRITEIVSHSFPDFELISYKLNEGENKAQFLSIINVITARMRSKVDSKEQELQVFLKSIPKNPFKHEMALEKKHFKREISMYNSVLPLLRNQRGFSAYPQVYYAICNDSTDFLAMENLKLSGYKSPDRLPGLDINHLFLAIKTVAELHASSISTFKDGNKILKQFPELVDVFFRGANDDEFSDMGKFCLSNTVHDIRKVLEEEGRDELIPKLEYFLGEYAQENILELVKIPQEFPSVINHGDLWTSNLMFLYPTGENSTCRVDLKLVDFQAAKVASRVLDLSHLIYTSASLSLLQTEESIHSLLRMYFDTFSEACQKFDYPYQQSWDNFLEEWESYKNFGLMIAVLLAFLMYFPPDDIPDVEKMNSDDLVKDVSSASTPSMFDKLWEHKLMRLRLIHLIQNHIPNIPVSHST